MFQPVGHVYMYLVFPAENREGPIFGEKDFDHGYYVVGHAYFKELDEIVSGDTIVGFGKVVEKYVVLLIIV